jgi:large subunit ribosomal protein L15e
MPNPRKLGMRRSDPENVFKLFIPQPVMGYQKYLKASGDKDRLMSWRREPVIKRLKNPTRPDRARSVGYKAKQGFLVVRVRVKRGGRNRPKFSRGRKPSKMGLTKYFPKKSLQWTAEEKAGRKFTNMEVLNSYWVGEDGMHTWFEVVLVDPAHPSLMKHARWTAMKPNRGRVFRGLTSAGKKGRGLGKRSHAKSRPSVRANKGQSK